MKDEESRNLFLYIWIKRKDFRIKLPEETDANTVVPSFSLLAFRAKAIPIAGSQVHSQIFNIPFQTLSLCGLLHEC